MDFLSFDKDIYWEIFAYLTIDAAFNMARTNKKFRKLLCFADFTPNDIYDSMICRSRHGKLMFILIEAIQRNQYSMFRLLFNNTAYPLKKLSYMHSLQKRYNYCASFLRSMIDEKDAEEAEDKIQKFRHKLPPWACPDLVYANFMTSMIKTLKS